MNYTVEIQENEAGELIIDLPVVMLAELGWEVGDDIVWTQNDNGTFTLTRKEND